MASADWFAAGRVALDAFWPLGSAGPALD